ncbi:MAG: hypothetical protein U0361_21570 [Nitrospiraceae bacterium]
MGFAHVIHHLKWIENGATSAAVPGIFITLEGIEGSGKSTQAKRLGAHLRALGYRIVETRPAERAGEEKIRAVCSIAPPRTLRSRNRSLSRFRRRGANT